MSFFQENGILTSRTSVGTDVITLTGTGSALDVKLVRLTLNSQTATGAGNSDYIFSYGMSDGTDERAICGMSQDNVGTSVCTGSHHDNAVVVVRNPAGTLLDLGVISAIFLLVAASKRPNFIRWWQNLSLKLRLVVCLKDHLY